MFLNLYISCNIRDPQNIILGVFMDVLDKTVLITGGASGLGFATAKEFISSGANVMLVDLNEENVKKASEELGDNSAYAIANVTEEESVQNCISKTMEKFGSIHVVVNCAGIGSASKTVGKDGAHPLDYFKLVIDINLVGTFNVLRLAAVEMGKNEPMENNECGVIINTASVQGLQSAKGVSAYAASKGGDLSLVRQLALDYAEDNIRVVAVNPGTIETPLLQEAIDYFGGDEDEIRTDMASRHAVNRLGTPEDVANSVVFLASSRASFITGEYLNVDGGLMARGAWA